MLLTAVGITKSKGKEKRKRGLLLLFQNGAQTTVITDCGGAQGFGRNLIGFHLPLPISETSRGKTGEGSTSRCTAGKNQPTDTVAAPPLPVLISWVKSGSLDVPSARQRRT